MLSLILTIIAVGAIAAAALFLYAQTKPSGFRIARTATIGAEPEQIFPLINNLREMNRWNPFVNQDPAIRIAYAGPSAGAGAREDWEGTKRTGKGSLEILEAVPSSRVTMLLQMVAPMEARNTVEFTLRPTAAGTEVTWAMTGESMCMHKVFGLFLNIDKMVGTEYEKGLADLKRIAESEARTDSGRQSNANP